MDAFDLVLYYATLQLFLEKMKEVPVNPDEFRVSLISWSIEFYIENTLNLPWSCAEDNDSVS